MKKDRSKNSIVDGLWDADKIGGVPYEEVQQTFCCKPSHLLEDLEPDMPDLSTYKFPNIEHNETEEIKT